MQVVVQQASPSQGYSIPVNLRRASFYVKYVEHAEACRAKWSHVGSKFVVTKKYAEARRATLSL